MAKKKSINYNPNTALIQGAAAVGLSMLPPDLSGLDKIVEGGISMLEKTKKERQELDDMLNGVADKVLAEAGGLGDEMYNYSLDLVEGYKQDYLRGVKTKGPEGEKIKRQAMNNMAQLANFADEHEELNRVTAENILEGNMTSNLSNEDKKMLNDILDKKYFLSENSDGQMVYNLEINGKPKQVTYEEYKKQTTRLKNAKFGDTYSKSQEVYFKKGRKFDRENFQHVISQDIPKTEQGFVDGLTDNVKGQTFIELVMKDNSIAKEALYAIANADGNDSLTLDNIETNEEEVKKQILSAIIDPKHPAFNLQRSREIMAAKMTDAAENAHNDRWAERDALEQKALDDYMNKQVKDTQRIYMPAVGGYVDKTGVDHDVALLNSDAQDMPLTHSYNNLSWGRQKGQYYYLDPNTSAPTKTNYNSLLAMLKYDEKHGIKRPRTTEQNTQAALDTATDKSDNTPANPGLLDDAQKDQVVGQPKL